MSKIFKPRYPTSNAGFWFTAISLALSYGLGAMLAIGIINNNHGGSFNLVGALLAVAVAALLLVGTVWWLLGQMHNQPQQVIVERDRLLIQDVKVSPARLEVEIPFAALRLVRVTDVPVEGGIIPTSFQGLIFRWRTSPTPAGENDEDNIQEYILSSRNVCDFDELLKEVFAHTPEAARGASTYRL
jgi:hypothetical protein